MPRLSAFLLFWALTIPRLVAGESVPPEKNGDGASAAELQALTFYNDAARFHADALAKKEAGQLPDAVLLIAQADETIAKAVTVLESAGIKKTAGDAAPAVYALRDRIAADRDTFRALAGPAPDAATPPADQTNAPPPVETKPPEKPPVSAPPAPNPDKGAEARKPDPDKPAAAEPKKEHSENSSKTARIRCKWNGKEDALDALKPAFALGEGTALVAGVGVAAADEAGITTLVSSGALGDFKLRIEADARADQTRFSVKLGDEVIWTKLRSVASRNAGGRLSRDPEVNTVLEVERRGGKIDVILDGVRWTDRIQAPPAATLTIQAVRVSAWTNESSPCFLRIALTADRTP